MKHVAPQEISGPKSARPHGGIPDPRSALSWSWSLAGTAAHSTLPAARCPVATNHCTIDRSGASPQAAAAAAAAAAVLTWCLHASQA
jgi:hypothetical protein